MKTFMGYKNVSQDSIKKEAYIQDLLHCTLCFMGSEVLRDLVPKWFGN